MTVLLIGTLDTKGEEIAYVRDRLLAAGVGVLVADAGVLGPPTVSYDLSRQELYAAGGGRFDDISRAADRGRAMTAAAEGAAKLADQLYRGGKITGVFGLGGSAGTTIGTAAMRALPVGVPKVMVSTLASGQVQPFVGTRDVTMIYSVVDLAGINRVSRRVLDNAAAAMAGMLKGREAGLAGVDDKPVVAATMFGVTTPCVEAARRVVEAAGFEVLVFHATGSGGRTMEGLIRDGLIAGVLDLTTTELADELAGGILSAGRDRLTAAAITGVPQVISVGALDMVNFGPPDTVPDKYRDRRFYQHNPNVTLMRTTPEENDRLGQEVAQKASAARGPTAILLPLRGVSAIDAEGKPFWWPEADAALFQSIRNWVAPDVDVVELDLHINDPAFAAAAAEKLLGMIRIPTRSA
ncbi:Tm-1-like ATP-binding domain-containing protein [Fimbriiglobus ruber]|uniref:Transcriptional regulator n=1 Tax=Fimbriiglobus ruber TaxID=1908690 RepID=A0A225DIR3_9BACT|nr:Tm-1-like ATP-binding domain-containing protein [Fimbriiglobus ruber]OWK36265.1 Transcriptional regulator [Fimbriiglobus ruber]